jgi:hypothetical protein
VGAVDVPLGKVHAFMTDFRSLPPAAALPDYLHALTESEGFTLDFDNLHELVADDPASLLSWIDPAGRVLTADYQQRMLANAIVIMREELPKPGYDLVQILILANNLAALLNKRQAVDDEMDQARAEFARACTALSHQGVIIPTAPTGSTPTSSATSTNAPTPSESPPTPPGHGSAYGPTPQPCSPWQTDARTGHPQAQQPRSADATTPST